MKNRIIRWWLSLRGAYRLAWGFCPRCNSDAPEIDRCAICDGYRSHTPGHTHPPPGTVLSLWRGAYRHYLKRKYPDA